ncbi:hypothetical protein ANTPLA_LOCUS2340 [Anthophora plagiata]
MASRVQISSRPRTHVPGKVDRRALSLSPAKVEFLKTAEREREKSDRKRETEKSKENERVGVKERESKRGRKRAMLCCSKKDFEKKKKKKKRKKERKRNELYRSKIHCNRGNSYTTELQLSWFFRRQ